MLVLVGALALREVADLVVPVVFGLFLALVTAPLIGMLERRGARRAVALTITVLVVLAVVVATLGVIALSVGELVVQVPKYQAEPDRRDRRRPGAARAVRHQHGPRRHHGVIKPEQVMSLVRPIASAVSGAGAAIFILASRSSMRSRGRRSCAPARSAFGGGTR